MFVFVKDVGMPHQKVHKVKPHGPSCIFLMHTRVQHCSVKDAWIGLYIFVTYAPKCTLHSVSILLLFFISQHKNKNTNNYHCPSAGSSNILGAFSSNMERSVGSVFFTFFFPFFLGFVGSPSTTTGARKKGKRVKHCKTGKNKQQQQNYTPSGKKKNRMNVEKVHMYVQCFSPFFQAWEDLLKFDTTAWYSYHWSIFAVKGLSLRGNTLRLYRPFAINELALWWHRIVHWLS